MLTTNISQANIPPGAAEPNQGVRFVHFSDLHVGMENQGWLWPAFKNAFLNDIRTLHRRTGAWDVVVFSGDLAQKASVTEYERLTEILQDIWKVFDELGFAPLLFPVPGNHDLTRPAALNAAATVLGQWWTAPNIQKAFWESKGNEYRKLVADSFKNYTNWLTSLREKNIPLPTFQCGHLPGDVSAVVEVRGLRLGLVGLNSAWLQLADGDYKGRLHVDTRQLLAVTNDDPDGWCASNKFNLLITHHPVDWLASQSLDHWRSEINTHTRFDGHLHGHMHEPSAITISEGGAAGRRSKQGASLFGLETVERNGIKRIHGYSACQILDSDGTRLMRHWPRKAHKGIDGAHKLVPDHDFNICDDGYFDETYNLQNQASAQPVSHHSEIEPHRRITNSIEILSSLRLTLPVSPRYLDVRRVEQSEGLTALEEKRALWLVADWGLGSEYFLRSLQDRLSIGNAQVYQLDCQRYFNRDDILAGVQEQVACSFEQLCELIASQPACILLFDDVPIAEGKDKDSKSLQCDIEQIVHILLQYCENARLIVKSRLAPANCALPTVELRPLDEADTAIYVEAHEHISGSSLTPQLIAQLFRHTDGVPARIDSVLRDIPIVGVSELHRLNIDVAGKAAATVSLAPGLAQTISNMQRSPDPAVKQAFELLKVLTVFPRGELLSTIKRFDHTKPFYLQDARSLMDLALIDSVEVPSVDPVASSDGARAMLVRRTVREYLYTVLSDTDLKNLNKRALALYFGDAWALKGIKSPKSHRFDERKCGAWQIGNANMMVLRATREAVDSGKATSQSRALELANAYCAALNKGDHYNGVLTLCGDIIPLLESIESSTFDLTMLRSFYGCALRMTGDYEKSRSVLQPIEKASASKGLRQSILLDLALSCQRLKDYDAAITAAKELIKLNPKSSHALQAQALLAGALNEDASKEQKLQVIEAKALRQKSYVVANNLALNRATECKDIAKRKGILDTVFASSLKCGDHHNGMRASLRLAKLVLDSGSNLDRAQLNRVIESYHYLYSDSIGGLFNNCHDVLWRAFELSNERENLLRLCRYSSLIWRLRSQEETELRYLNLLSARLGAGTLGDISRSNRELTYFLARTSHAMMNSQVLEPQNKVAKLE